MRITYNQKSEEYSLTHGDNAWELNGSKFGDLYVTFTANVAPDNIEGETSIENLFESFDTLISYMNWVKEIIGILGKEWVTVEGDYYWDDEDLLVRINIPLNHPLITIAEEI